MLDILIFVAGGIILGLIWVMLYDSNRFVVRNYVISDPRIRQDCRMVVVADLHDKCYGQNNLSLIDAIKEQKPDLIMVAGDILTARPKEKLKKALTFVEEILKIAPVCYGNGNHEHRLKLYPETYGTLAEEYEEGLEKLGIHRLVNAYTVFLEKGIAVYGSEIDREYYKRGFLVKMDEHYLEGLLGKADESLYTILIAHDPDYFKNYAGWGADLNLSGHVHGGIIRVPFIGKGLLSPAVRLFPKYDGGLFEEEKKKMIVSRGLGSHTIPFRLFNPGELVVVDLKSGQES